MSATTEGRIGDIRGRTENAWLIGELPLEVSGSRSGAGSKRRGTGEVWTKRTEKGTNENPERQLEQGITRGDEAIQRKPETVV